MAVDMNAAEGRICLLRGRSTEVFPWYEKGGKIIRMSGKRAYFLKEDGTETFSHEFSAICDTPAEEESLLQFSVSIKARLKKLLDTFGTEAAILEAALNASVPEMKSISTPRVRRVSKETIKKAAKEFKWVPSNEPHIISSPRVRRARAG